MVVVKRHYRVSKRLTIQGLGKVSKVKSHLRKPIREFEYLQVD